MKKKVRLFMYLSGQKQQLCGPHQVFTIFTFTVLMGVFSSQVLIIKFTRLGKHPKV